jgi:methylenetetrahydrofolate--tRNA-(uracil-5-)-methyltransferase
MADLIVVGGGLAGSEAAWQAAERGLKVDLYEMRPQLSTGAHTSSGLAELVCSNSLGSLLVDRPSGLLKEEIRRLGSLLLTCAENAALPAGGALAVDRDLFAAHVTQHITEHTNIRLLRAEVTDVPTTTAVIASGPLTSPSLAKSIQALTDQSSLFFFDAIAPIVRSDTINMQVAYRASRNAHDVSPEGDYINCPLDKNDYDYFVNELVSAERIQLHEFETAIETSVTAGASEFFEGCLPVEILARRGKNTLAFGPMRPVGLKDPRTGRWPHAVVQLRQDNQAATLYNLVGFQTNLTFAEQRRVLRLIPGLEKAEFIRYGQMHRNTFIASPKLLRPTLQLDAYPDLFFAGQITGVEGYLGNIATGLLAGINAVRYITQQKPLELPIETMLGGLCHYITHAQMQDFQPMKANYGILPPLANPADSKRERALQCGKRSINALNQWAARNHISLSPGDAVLES